MATPWERWGKDILKAALYLVPRRVTPPLPVAAGQIRRVLVVRPDERIGNLILLTPMLDAMRQAWPEAAIDMVAGGATAVLMQRDPRLGGVIVFDKRALIRNPLRLAGIGRRLRRERYDLAVDASHPHHFSLTAALLTRASGARRSLGYLGGPGGRLLDYGLLLPAGSRRHLTDVFIDLLRVVAPEATNGGLNFPIHADETAEAKARLGAAGVEEGATLVGLHPGGRGRKRWPLERFVDLIRRLETRPGRRVVVFHGPGEEDLVAEIPAGVGLVAPLMPLRLFAAALSRCRLFISGDTGPMHLAAAVGVPTLALFLQANFEVFGPRGGTHRILFNPDGLGVDEVAAAAEAMLRASTPAAGGRTPIASGPR